MNSVDQYTSCPGFLDEYGVWNNGFECPSLSNQIRVCCGSDSYRYCCTLENIPTSSLNSLNTNEKNFFKINETNFLTLPIKLTCILIIILILLLILIILIIFYRYYKRNKNIQEKNLSTKQTLIMDHFPFSSPNHKLFFNNNNNNNQQQQQQIKDTLTTSTSSASSASILIPSEIYFNDWKEFFNINEQSMNIYPTISSNNNDLFHGKYQQDDDDVIV